MPLADFLRQAPPAPKGGLERVLGTLDRPGKVARGLLSGEFGLAGKNLLNLVEEAPTLGLAQLSDLPGGLGEWIQKNLETTRAQDRELDWGVAGNIASDPLTYLTGGTAGAAKAVLTAGGKAGARRLAAEALKQGLTKAGKAKLAQEVAEKAIELSAKAPKMAAQAPDAVKQVAERKVLQSWLKGTGEQGARTYEISDKVGKELLDQGGLKVGLPFMEGKTIAAAGTDVLKYHPAAMTMRAIKNIPVGPGGKTLGAAVGKALIRGHGLEPAAKRLLQEHDVEVGSQLAEANRWLNQEIGPKVAALKQDDMLDLWAAKQGFDPRVYLEKGLLGGSKLPKAIDLTPQMRAAGKAGAAAARQRVAANPELKKLSDLIEDSHIKLQAAEKALGIDQGTVTEYLRRSYSPDSPYLLGKAGMAMPVRGPGLKGFTKGRKFEDIADAIEAGLIPEVNPIAALQSRLEGSIKLVAATRLARKATKGASTSLPEGALADAFQQGQLRPRNVLEGALHQFNKVFKPAATTGIGPVINPAFHARNLISGLFQGMMDKDVGWRVFGMARPSTLNIVKNWSNPSKLKGAADIAPGLSAEQAAREIRQWNVARNTFAETELLTKGVLPKTRSKSLNAILGASQNIGQGVEGLMRINAFLALRKSGVGAADAAKRVNRVFVDYQIVSPAHRTIRDVFPFAQFTIGTMPPLLETLARSPRFATPVRELIKAGQGEEDGPMPPWMAAQATIPAGKNAAGQRRYVTSLGTIFEQLNTLNQGSIPGTIERSVLGQSNPLVKAPAQLATGRDFYFQQPLEYGRTPRELQALGMDETMDPRMRMLYGSLPYTRQLGTIDKALDANRSWWEKAVDMLTGVKVATVDDERVYRDLIRRYLEEKAKSGDVAVIQRFYARNMDPELAALIKQYQKKRPKKAS